MGLDWLIGKTCTRVYQHYPENFSFEFGQGLVRVDCLWRIVADGRLVRTSYDHERQYGLPTPINAYAEAESLLRGRCVSDVRVREETADLLIAFEGGILLEVISDSSGYEPWGFNAPGVHLVAIGGGGIADFSSGSPQ